MPPKVTFVPAVAKAVRPQAKKLAKARKRKKTPKKKTPAKAAPKELIGARIPKPMLDELRKLIEREYKRTGRRPLLTDLVTLAIADFLKKNRKGLR